MYLAEWVVPKPVGLTLEESMILGTAGFTAALAVHLLFRCGQTTGQGPVLVTGATGGVGSLAVALLAKCRFDVIASSGKPGRHELLTKLGAKEIIDRAATNDASNKALLKPRWAGGD